MADRPPPASALDVAALWRPHDSITGPAERRRARVTLALLLALAGLGALDLVASLGGAYGAVDSDALVEVFAVVGILLAYFTARAGRVVAAVVMAVVVVEATIWAFRFGTAPGPGEATLLYFLVVPLLLAGLLLPLRPAILVAAATIAFAILGEMVLHQGSALRFEVQDFGLLLLLTAAALLSIMASALSERDARLLQETTALLKEVTDNIPEVLFVVAGDGTRVLYTSPAYETVLGRTVEQAMADPRDWLKAVHPEDLPRILEALKANARELEYRALHSSGSLRHIRARTFPIVGPDGDARIVGIAEDVTPTVEAQERLRDAQRQRIHLLQQLAHDLASPLSPVKIQLRILKDHVGPNGEKSLAILRRNIDHVQRLVEDVKDVARLEGSGLKLDRKPTDLADLARQALDTLGPSAAERQVHLALDAPPSLPAAVDPGRITQVMYNLVGNALKFTPTNGRIDIELARRDAHAEVQVRDSGSGMRPDQVARLFQPFVQVHEASEIRRPEDRGTGLGLFISKGIVEAHGGSIAASSGGPGQGSTFTFRLPLADPA